MSAAPNSRRTVAEINFGEGAATGFNIGNRSIHQFWHLFSAHFRGVLLAPQRRPDSGKVAWTWREPAENAPLTPQELALVRQRLSEASRLLTGGGKGLLAEGPAGGSLDAQVREKVGDMIAQLTAQGDQLLAGFVCRTETGPMVHSWGAATPAKPHYPGASEGALGGTVFLGPDRVAGLTVVLENRSGGFVARIKSGEAGAFSFQNVAPGNYRLRVTGRGEFPAGGVAVTMERESITGLELRGKATAESGGAAPAPTPTTPSLPARVSSQTTRRVLTVLALLLAIGGGGFYFWRSDRPAVGAGPDANGASGWQSASREVGGPAGPEAPADARAHGRDDHWSDLKPAPSLPATPGAAGHIGSKPSGSPHTSAKLPSAKSSSPAGQSPVAENSPAGDLSAPPDKSSGPAGPDNNRPAIGGASAQNKSDPERGTKGAATERTVASKEATDRADEPDESSTAKAEKGAAAAADKARAKAPRAGTPASSAPAADAPDETGPADGTPPAVNAGSATASSTASSLPSAPAAGKNPGNPGVNESADATDAAAPSATPDAPATGDTAASAAGRIGSQPSAPAKKTSHTLSTNPGAIATTTSVISGKAANSSDSPADPETASTHSAKPSTPAKRPAPAASTDTTPPKADVTADPSVENPELKPASATPAKIPPKRAAAAAGKPSATEPKTMPPSIASDDSAATVPPDTTAPAEKPVARTQAKPPWKNAPTATGVPDTGAEAVPEEPTDAASGPAPVATANVVAASPLIPLGRVSATAWKSRQVQDLILPTKPVLETEDDAVEALRQQTRREQAARIPAAFKQPSVTTGIAVEFPLNRAGGSPHWHDAAGGKPADSTVQGNRTEVAWPATSSARPVEYILSYPDGTEIARVRTDESGAPTLTVAANVRGWYWVGITAAKAAPSLSPESNPPGWRLLSGAPVPPTWPQSDRWPGGRGHRLDLPLGGSPDKRSYALALVDPTTGWALVSEITVGRDR